MTLHDLFTLLNLPIGISGHDMTQLHYRYFPIETSGYNTEDIQVNTFRSYKYINTWYGFRKTYEILAMPYYALYYY